MADLANLGLDRFGQDAGQFRALADQLDRYAELGGIQAELRAQRIRSANTTASRLPSATVAAPRIDDVVRRFGAYCDHVQVPEVLDVYRAVRDLAGRARATAEVIDRCEIFERNWLDQFGHDLGRDWDKAWHTVFERDRSDEINRLYDQQAAEAQTRSAERASALESWRRAVYATFEVIDRATAALAVRSPECPVELTPPCLPGDPPVRHIVLDRWYERSVIPYLRSIEDDPPARKAWWDQLTAQERLVLRDRRPDLAAEFPPEDPGPGDPGYCAPGDLASDRYIGRTQATTDFLGLPRMPECAQDIPAWFQRYRYQLTQVRLPFVEAVTFLRGLSKGLMETADMIGVPHQFILACNDGDELACVKLGVALGMAVPTGGFRSPSSRHLVTGVNQRTVAKNRNTVVAPWVDLDADIQAINAGRVDRVDGTYTVNGRTYGSHDGTLYPIRGEGFAELDRPGFKALGVFNSFGDTPRAMEILQKMGLPADAIDAGRRAWEMGR